MGPEPWLRGPLADVHPLIAPVFFSFAQTREDLELHVSGLTVGQVWRKFGRASVGFHLKHMAGSVDRLSTYLTKRQLSQAQLDFLTNEHTAEGGARELIGQVAISLTACEASLRQLDPADAFSPRTVGRQHLPTTVLGLLVHLAEHTQRHLGQTITLAQMVRTVD